MPVPTDVIARRYVVKAPPVPMCSIVGCTRPSMVVINYCYEHGEDD